MMNGQLNRNQLKALQNALSDLELPPKKRQRLLWRMAKYGVIQAARHHVRHQQSPDGGRWADRKSPWRKKMLRNIPKLLHRLNLCNQRWKSVRRLANCHKMTYRS
ncbi:Phage virion morphogenesis family [Photorhabdus khanii NC19]|uniref:Phage virion morphogenesis family n=1 Tax=Photorhabdus khanii NC19 TaxID=1004151 RepID=W3VB04_9GAMM|nr:Phage virion morphogenesis family [Photorhabdus khanii NC19]